MTRFTPDKPNLRSTAVQVEDESRIRSLTIHVPERDVRTIAIERGKSYVLGRHESSDIVLENTYVSARHARLNVGEQLTIVDLGSRNSTYVDGQRLSPQQPCPLRVGSVVSMGPVALFAQAEVFCSGVHPVLDRKRADSRAPAQKHPVMRDRGMLQLYAFTQQVARTSAPVLITGETGVGKELIAQAIHRHSSRAQRELVVLNCAAIPESLVESELFGFERGAFSGAVGAKPGLFEIAHKSTFFLDEIGELALPVQAKLLRVLETGEVSRIGALRPTRVDVRIVAATNRDLPAEVGRGAFRADLYYRLNGLTIAIPPLRARPEDIEALAQHFATACGAQLQFSDAAMAALRAHSWPGNVRELKSVVERLALVNPGEVVEPADLKLDVAPIAFGADDPANGDGAAHETTAQFAYAPRDVCGTIADAELEPRELRRIKEALERTAGNQTEAARLLGISRRTLMNRMDRLGISRPRKGARRSNDG